MFGFNFPPRNWALCDGQLLPINQYQSLYSLLGTIYGGDGRTTFALPELRGRVPMSFDDAFRQGTKSGEESHVLATAEMPSHTHDLRATNNAASTDTPQGNVLASPGVNVYAGLSNQAAMNAETVANAGANFGHTNMQPYLTVSFCIALMGVFPSR